MVSMQRVAAALVSLCALVLAACETAPVTGREQLVLLPESQAASMGAQAYQEILAKSTVASGSRYSQRVQRVGRRIAQVSGATDLDWQFNVIEDDSPNAFALPGGKVGVNTGLFKVVENDNQLAAVLAHEIAHVTARHSSERISRQLLIETGLTAVGLASASQGAQAGQYAQLLATAVTVGAVLPFSRQQEAEADEIGLTYMARAGYDPRAAIEVWQNFQKAGGERPPEFLSTHPSPTSRIDRLRRLVPEVMPIYQQNADRG